jgi:tetratricopeptide (TPR) repeat protein/transglutaminase-like putative cysteine protease
MKSMRSRISLALALFVWVVIPVFGQAQVQTPAKDKPAAPRDYSKEAYVIEKLQTRIAEEADGSGTREVTAEVKVLAEAGVKAFAVLTFTYTSANEVVDVDYVRVRKPDGTVVKTPDYNVQDMPAEVSRAAPLYSDIHEKHVAVKGLGVGDVLEYLVRFRVVKPQVPGHFWYEHSFAKDAIIKDEKLELSLPGDKYVKVVSPEFKPAIKDEKGRRIYLWAHSNLEVKEKDPNEIPRRIPPNPSVQVTTFASWEDVGRWYGGLQKDPLEVTPAIRAKAAELTKGLKTDDEKLRAIYTFVSLRFHYIGLDFGIGRYQPHAADDVLGNGYGDCKDKHTLLAALLKAAGYDAWPALIHGQRKLDPDVPSPAQFNHVITVVPAGGQLIWLDTTPEVAPYGLLLIVLRNKQALVIPSNAAASLMKTPENAPFPQSQKFSAKGKLGADGTFSGHVEQSYRGDVEVALRALFRQVAQSQWKEAAQGFSYGRGFAGDVSNVTVTSPDALEKPFELSYDYVRKNYGDWENHQIIAPLPPLGVEVTKDSREKNPSEPIPLNGPGEIEYRGRIELPPGYSAVAPKGLDVVEPYAEYHTTNVIEGGVLATSRRLVVKKAQVEVSEWEGFRKFGRLIADDEYNFIPLSGASVTASGDGKDGDGGNADQDFHDGYNALQMRDARRAQELFEKVIKVRADYHGAHFNLGLALAAQNKTDEALNEFHKEEQISPDNPQPYTAAASLENFRGHKDDAMQEWRRLLKADPKNHDAALNLGQLLFQSGKYSESAEVLEGGVKAAPDSWGLQFILGTAYLKMGQSEKAVIHMRAAAEEGGNPKRDVDMLNNVAYTLAESKTDLELARQYAEQASEVLETRSADTSANDIVTIGMGTEVTYQLSLVWDTLGWVYFQSGDANRSESFVRSAWLLGQDAIVGEHLGEIYQKLGRSKEAAHVYELALAAQGSATFRMAGSSTQVPLAPIDVNGYRAQQEKILASYEKLTGKKPSREIHRLPNGEWSKTPAEQLSQMRTANFGKLPKLSGMAEFAIVFAPGKIESVEYVSGEKSLQSLTEKLKTAHYQVDFPAGSKARILRRAQLSCTPSAGCMAVLMPPANARFGQGPRQY